MVSYGRPLVDGVKFGLSPKKWPLLFVLDLAVLLVGLAVLLNINLAVLLTADAWQLALAFWPMIAVFVAAQLVKLWVYGAFVYQAWKPKEWKASFSVAGKRYLAILAIAAILFLLNTAIGQLSNIAYTAWLGIVLGIISTILAAFVALIFFFPYQATIISKTGPLLALLRSWRIFRKAPGRVFLIWLLVSIIGGAIGLAFSIPFMLWIMPAAQTPALLMAALLANIPLVLVLMAILLAGSAIATAFTIKATTAFYLQFRPEKPK